MPHGRVAFNPYGNPMTTLHDVTADLVFGTSGEAAIARHQHIPQSFLDECKAERDFGFAKGALPEAVTVARVPVAVVETWLRQGFNIWDKDVDDRAIVRRLRAQGLDHFITTSRKV